MPQRTNDFQELVDIIHRLYAPHNAKVTTSAMVEVSPGLPPREVDVLVEYETDLYPIKVAVEAKDHTRKIGVKTVEDYAGKYNTPGGIAVSKVIIVAREFTKGAVARAKQLAGFELHTLKTLEESKVDIFSKIPDDHGGWWIETSPDGEKVNVTLIAADGKQLDESYLHGTFVARASQSNLGIPLAVAKRILDGGLGRQVSDLYEERSGQMLRVLAEMMFEDHEVTAMSHPTCRLKSMIFDFGKRMRIPDLQTRVHELKTSPDKSKRLVCNKGQGPAGSVHIAYEDAEKPSKLYLQHTNTNALQIVIKLPDFTEN